MGRKHYEAIAKVLCDTFRDATLDGNDTCLALLDSLTGELVTVFKNDNKRFDKERFLEAVNRCQR